jgi:hypothetical protein
MTDSKIDSSASGIGAMQTMNTHLSSADKAYTGSKNIVDTAQKELDSFINRDNSKPLTDSELIQFNLAASNYSTRLSMVSGLVKNLADNEKQIANKM